MHLPRLTGLLVGFFVVSFHSASAAVGRFAQAADVGAPAIVGSTSYDPSVQHYRMSAGGTNMWGTTDQFHFAWNVMKGDFIVRARVEWIGQGVDPHRKAGWIARRSLDHDSAYVDACVHGGDGLTSLQYRREQGAETEQIVLPLTGGDVVQLERRGDSWTFSSARYGETFVSETLTGLDLGEEPLVGLFLCSHNAEVKEEAIFKDVRIIRPPKAGYVPYRDFIGAHLEILNVHTGKLEIVHSSPVQFEAPNWKPDGRTLILNISGQGPDRGKLKTFDLVTKEIADLYTGTIGRNNNDHVLTFDGTMLGVSIHTPGEDEGRSVVYKLPSTGGEPVRVTPRSPSYFHGWSPDAQWLVYTGGRKETPDATSDKYDIYKISADGGEEIRLTREGTLSDGPEFTPDGQWIYYNSTRSGLMQIWRMRPDGSDQRQVTDDAFNNWFPHVSPDGKWIVFLSYGQDVRPEEHPYYKHCYIRLMPIEGGPARVVAYVFGGQGTINVPSWSPDSTRIAFVSNSDGV
ncbi:SMP-30/gluconolactonase/LRE family protein [Opitutales bacterium ASA1]|uniref:TolB family protein n=1 Tax=Congregicoccus parvus TaxID=3081749 RepID=UPI002B283F9D|nr:SMP-30/gluconolactonase/LRE family protein [Opitutales bacterium ASA1]